MPWRECSVMEERLCFATDWRSPLIRPPELVWGVESRRLFLFAKGRKWCDGPIDQVDGTFKYCLGLSKAG